MRLPTALLTMHRWLATPPRSLPDNQFEQYAMTNWAMALGLLSHVAFMLLFWALGAQVLAYFNLLSIAVFATALAMSRRAHFNASLITASSEVVMHAWLATVVLGWETGFHFHVLLALVLFVLFSTLTLGHRLVAAALISVAYIAMGLYGALFPPTMVLGDTLQQALTLLNMSIFLTVFSGICLYHTWTVSLTREARVQAEADVRQALSKARELERMKTDFTATVSHELRTPLTSILGFAKMIRKKLDDDLLPHVNSDAPKVLRSTRQVRGNLDIVISEGERLTDLINDVLDIAKMEAGHMEYARETVTPEELVRRAHRACSGLFGGQTKVLFTVDSMAELPRLHGDPDRLQQVLVNLISNAAKFTEEGEVAVRAVRDRSGVRFSVSDTGPGIPPDKLDRIFDRFQQLGTLDDKPKGTGLGLAICKQIVDAHGGRIWVESPPGEGASFVFTLPDEKTATAPGAPRR